MYSQYIDNSTDFQRLYPQVHVTKLWGIKDKTLSKFRIFLITNTLCIKKGENMKCLKSVQTIYFRKVLDETNALQKI